MTRLLKLVMMTLSACSCLKATTDGGNITEFEKEFRRFIDLYGKKYRNTSNEYSKRFENFKKNLERQVMLNDERDNNASAFYGITKFSDMDQKEFEAQYLSSMSQLPLLQSNVNHRYRCMVNDLSRRIPKKIDWRYKNKVTPVKNQQSCGACWAFSVVQMIESVAAVKTGVLRELSVQEMIDCSFNYKQSLLGCRGGDTCSALNWLMETKTPLLTEKKYPLEDKDQLCLMNKNESSGILVTEYKCQSFIQCESDMLLWIATKGPLAVAVDATNWNNYLGGVIQHHCGERPNNHAVEIIGYDLTGEIPYYIVKNSWGKDFGNNGYLYIAVGSNVCGIANEVASAEVTSV